MSVSLREYRSQKQALPDLLNWASMIESGIVLNKDGSLMAGVMYRGSDLATASVAGREQVVNVLNAALIQLGSGWMVHIDAVRIPARNYPAENECHFEDEVTRLIDAERRAMFAGDSFFTTEYVLFFTWLPPQLTQSKVVDMLVEDNGGRRGVVQEQLVQQFQVTLESVIDRLSAVFLVERLEGDSYLTVMHWALSGLRHPVRVPSVPMYLDAVIGGHEFWTGMTPKLEDKYFSVVAIEGFPAESYPQMLQVLDSLGTEYRWNTRWMAMDTVHAVAHLNKYRRKWGQKVRGFLSQVFKTSNGQVNQDAVAMVETTDLALAEANSGQVGFGYYTSVVVLFDENRLKLDEQARAVAGLVNNLGFVARIEGVNAVEAWLGSLPGHGYQNVRRPMMSTMNLGDLLPTSAVWPGNEYAPCDFYPERSPPLLYAGTAGSTPFRFNLHVGDLGHTLMIGPTGSGKSTALAFIAAQFRRYQGATVFAFDKGNSLLPLSLAVQGQHFDVSGDESSHLHFAPLSRLGEEGWFGLIEAWCEGLFVLQDQPLSAAQKSELHRALDMLEKGQAEKTLSALRTTVQDAEMKAALEPYTVGGVCGELLDSVDDGVSLSSWNCFEIEELMNRPDAIKLPVLLYLFMVIEKSLKGQPALLILDEAWLMLGHKVFREKLREWLKVLRKANCAVVVATQSLSDAANSGILDVLTESCPTKIFLANAEASSDLNLPMYRNMGLSEAEIAAIAGMTAKREYFIKAGGEGKRVVNFELGELALAFCGVSDKESLAVIKQKAYNDKEEWFYYYMQKRGINYEQYI